MPSMRRKHDSAPTGAPLSEKMRRRRDRLDALAWLLDSAIRLPGGFRIGIDALLGLLPFLGDAAGVLLSTYLVREAARLGAPSSLLLHMGLNVAIDGLVGAIPFLGDLFDAAWKANRRNIRLLDRYLENPVAATRSNRLVIGLLLALLVAFLIGMSLLSALFLNWIWQTVKS